MAYTARKESEVKEYFDDPSALQKKIKKLAALVRRSNHFVVYTGAGISTSCGIADYRSGINTVLKTGAGKWAKEAAAQQGKLSKQQLQTLENAHRKNKVSSTFKAIPSASHMALIALANTDYLKHLVSQNTDGLHRRSNFPLDKLSELHGNSTLEVCSDCDKVYMRDFRCRNKAAFPKGILSRLKYVADKISNGISKDGKYTDFIIDNDKEKITVSLSEAYEIVRNKNSKLATKKRKNLLDEWKDILDDIGFKMPRYLHFTGRHCTVKGCTGELTDTIINFGESLPEDVLRRAQRQSSKADLYLVLGSSCTVTPAADMPQEVGEKWYDEMQTLENDEEPAHNLIIVNIQKTPLHDLCSVPIHAKIDDVMFGLMKELELEIPRWCLIRYVMMNMCNVGNTQKMLCITGSDRDGTPFSLFKSVVLRYDGKRIRKLIDNKQSKEHEYKYIISMENEESVEYKNDVDGLTLELEFCGNYEEPNVVICLNEYLDEFIRSDVEGQIVLKMMMDPSSKVWCVPKRTEQLEDKDVKSLWFVKKENNDHQIECKTDD